MSGPRYNKQKQLLCGGTSKRTGRPCGAVAMANGTCYHHGGKSPKGIEHPSYVNGKTSMYPNIPARLADRYQENLDNPELLGLRPESAIMATLLDDALAHLDTGTSRGVWQDVRQVFNALKKAMDGKDNVAINIHFQELEHLITTGTVNDKAVEKVLDIAEQRRKMAESHSKLMVQAQQMITVPEQMALAAELLAVVKEVVSDKQLVTIAGRYGEVTNYQHEAAA